MGDGMKGRAFASMALAVTLAVTGQAAQQTGAAKESAKAQAANKAPDLTGVWAEWRRLSMQPDQSNLPKQPPAMERAEPMVLTPFGKERFLYNKDPLNERDRGRNELDPASHCFPPGPVRIAPPFEILQTPTKITIIYEDDHTVRQIFTDGRKHPDDLELTWNGHSIGKWEGDTLVVDTIGMRDESWLDGAGHVHSDQLHLVERIRRVSHEVLEIKRTLTDPKVLAQPWSQTTTYPLSPGWDLIENYRCEEHLQRGTYLGEGPSGL